MTDPPRTGSPASAGAVEPLDLPPPQAATARARTARRAVRRPLRDRRWIMRSPWTGSVDVRPPDGSRWAVAPPDPHDPLTWAAAYRAGRGGTAPRLVRRLRLQPVPRSPDRLPGGNRRAGRHRRRRVASAAPGPAVPATAPTGGAPIPPRPPATGGSRCPAGSPSGAARPGGAEGWRSSTGTRCRARRPRCGRGTSPWSRCSASSARRPGCPRTRTRRWSTTSPPGAALALGGGWYDTLLRLDDVDGKVALTVTTAQDLPVTRPTEAYLATIAAGRAERARPAPVRRRARGSAR